MTRESTWSRGNSDMRDLPLQPSSAQASLPGLLSGEGVTLDDVRRHAEAADHFFRSAPWRHWMGLELFRLLNPRPPSGIGYFSFMGGGGEEFGLAFFNRMEHFERLLNGSSMIAMQGAWSITFDSVQHMPAEDAALWLRHGLPACDGMYPLPCFMSLYHLRRPCAARLRVMTDLLHTTADLRPAHFRDGAVVEVPIPGTTRLRSARIALAALAGKEGGSAV